MMHNVACIFALAAASAGKEPQDVELAALAARCRQRALEAVRQTLALVPPTERLSFWNEKIVFDPALESIRNLRGFKALALSDSVLDTLSLTEKGSGTVAGTA